MAILFELKGKASVFDMKEFCRFKNELTYIGRFANKETSKVIQGTIIQYNGKFYTNEVPFHAGVSSSAADEEGMVTTTVELFETNYVPEECKSLGNCQIRINVWELAIDDEGPTCSYAFYNDQLEEAKKVVNGNKDVDIFIEGVQISRKDFLELKVVLAG